MTKQTHNNDDNVCYEIARWNEAFNPQYDDVNKQWLFSYPNGGNCDSTGEPRSWAPTFICDETTELSYGQVVEVSGICRYEIDIMTKYACLGAVCDHNSSKSDDEELSGGWIFIIMLLVGMFLYFTIGYVYMASTVNKEGGFADFENNIPHRSFWCSLPFLTIAGCQVTKEFIMGFFNKGD